MSRGDLREASLSRSTVRKSEVPLLVEFVRDDFSHVHGTDDSSRTLGWSVRLVRFRVPVDPRDYFGFASTLMCAIRCSTSAGFNWPDFTNGTMPFAMLPCVIDARR